jgi:hypothetical protein
MSIDSHSSCSRIRKLMLGLSVKLDPSPSWVILEASCCAITLGGLFVEIRIKDLPGREKRENYSHCGQNE